MINFKYCINFSTIISCVTCKMPNAFMLFQKVTKEPKFLSSVVPHFYHTSSPNFKWPKKVAKTSKFVIKSKPVKIWENMTIYDVARSARKNMDFINEVIKPALGNFIEMPSGRIKNLNGLRKILTQEQFEVQIINGTHAREVKKEENNNVTNIIKSAVTSQVQVKRPPVVGIMGHVDHGKTTLLDSLRNSNIVSGEFGGITQHIGAFSVTLPSGDSVTFIDTPGHSAFSAMRSRGAQATDIVVLVVAADDGVMEQTVESIKMAKNANVRIIVAVNKIDTGQNNLEEIKKQLLIEGLQAEDLGGDVQVVPISALKKINLDKLIESILAEAEMMNLTGNPDGPVEGVVLESSKTPSGKCATVLVRQGTLRRSDFIVAGTGWAKVRAMNNEDGRSLTELTLSQAAQVTGWRELPAAGDKVYQVKTEKDARTMVKVESEKIKKRKMEQDYSVIQEKLVQYKAEHSEKKAKQREYTSTNNVLALKLMYMKKKESTTPDIAKLDIIIKGDVDGSVDAIMNVINTYQNDEKFTLSVITSQVGQVTKSDIELAEIFDATIYCFNIDYPEDLKDMIIERGIRIKFHNVIYRLVEDLQLEIQEHLPLEEVEEVIGRADVIQHFNINVKTKKVPVAGSMCTSGELKKDAFFKVIRNEQVIFDGKLKCLKHEKNEVNTIKKGVHCGIMLEDYNGSFHPDDKIVCYIKKMTKIKKFWDPGF